MRRLSKLYAKKSATSTRQSRTVHSAEHAQSLKVAASQPLKWTAAAPKVSAIDQQSSKSSPVKRRGQKDAWTQPSPSAFTTSSTFAHAANEVSVTTVESGMPGESLRQDGSSHGCYFRDGRRRVDYVLVWEEDLNATDINQDWLIMASSYRRNFEENLIGAGLELERETSVSLKKKIHYLKVFVSWPTMCFYAEYLAFRAPVMKMCENKVPESELQPETKGSQGCLRCCATQEKLKKSTRYYTSAFLVSKLSKYVGSNNRDAYFRPTQRFEVAFEVLGTQVYGRRELSEVGLDSMLRRGIYSCAFPPHEGSFKLSRKMPTQQLNSRQVLHRYWARWVLWYKAQPLDHIRDYFGEKIAFYFAFIGHYTAWLIPASLVGLAVFFYGVSSINSNEIVRETCNSQSKFKMCPLCDDENSKSCGYWYLSEVCAYIMASYLFDNWGTLFYSFFASLWAYCFLESWKQRAASLAYRWDMPEFAESNERARPEYISRCTEYAKDPVTGLMVPHFSHAERLPRLFVGVISLMFLMFLSAVCLFIMLLFRAYITSALFSNEHFRSRALTVANIACGCFSFTLVMLLEYACYYVAFATSEWEMHRTQTEFENQVILKVFIFELFNYYLSISYTAFIKANVGGKPGEYNRLVGSRLVECLNGSCMFELTQYLAIIFISNQVLAQFSEFVYPKLCSLLHRGASGLESDQSDSDKQWEADFALVPYESGLFWEYLETSMQFAFVTLFVPAFPLAPLFAFINNVVEIRLDARKLVLATRRPLPERAQGIGIWYSMLNFIAYLATISNASLMAFTSEFLPTTMYSIMYKKGLSGYKNFTLSWAPSNTTSQPCQYNGGFGNYSEFYWKLQAARVIFVLGFQQVIFTVSSILSWIVPTLSKKLDLKKKRQKYFAKQALLEKDDIPRRYRRVAFLA